MSYLVAAYAVVLISVGAYGAHLARERGRLRNLTRAPAGDGVSTLENASDRRAEPH